MCKPESPFSCKHCSNYPGSGGGISSTVSVIEINGNGRLSAINERWCTSLITTANVHGNDAGKKKKKNKNDVRVMLPSRKPLTNNSGAVTERRGVRRTKVGADLQYGGAECGS